MIQQRKDAGICRNKKEKATQEKITIQLQEINQKGRLKRYQQRVNNTDKTGHSKTTKENSINNWEEITRKHTSNWTQKKPNDFGRKYGNGKKGNEKTEWINNMTRELEGLEEGLKAEIHIDLLKTTLKKMSIGKTPGHYGIYGFCFKKFTSIHDRLALEMNKCLRRAHVPE